MTFIETPRPGPPDQDERDAPPEEQERPGPPDQD